jgi:hypothetical protein
MRQRGIENHPGEDGCGSGQNWDPKDEANYSPSREGYNENDERHYLDCEFHIFLSRSWQKPNLCIWGEPAACIMPPPSTELNTITAVSS